jgi:serine phosphatase RsbU (regulator of sigma subunit)
MYKNIALLLLGGISLLLLPQASLAQEDQVPKLKATLSRVKTTRSEMVVSNDLAMAYLSASLSDSSIRYANRALDLSHQLISNEDEFQALNTLKSAYLQQGMYEKAVLYEIQLAAYYEKINNEEKLTETLKEIGDTYRNEGVYGSALQYYLYLLKIREEQSDTKGIVNVMNDIGVVFREQKNYKESLRYFTDAFDLLRKSPNFVQELGETFSNIGTAYYFMNSYDSANLYFEKAYTLKTKIGNFNEIAKSINDLGLIQNARNNYPQAIKKFTEALNILANVHSEDFLTTNIILNNIGTTYLKSGDLKKALEYQKEALYIATQSHIKERVLVSYQSLVDTYKAMDDFKSAYQYEHLYNLAKDTLYTNQTAKQIAEMQTRYDSEQKQKSIEILSKQNEINILDLKRRNQFLIFLGIGLLLSSVLGFVIYGRYRFNQKANKLLRSQNVEILEKKQEIMTQRDTLEEQSKELSITLAELDRKSHAVVSSLNYASRIQAAILPQKKELDALFSDCLLFFQPRSVVSGDFYWLGKVPKPNGGHKIIFTAVDGTGHGVPGAFMSLVGSSLLKEIVHTRQIVSPEQILIELDEGVKETLQQHDTHNQDGMDLALCMIDFEEGIMEFAGAKNPLIVIQDEELQVFKGDRYGIGGIDKVHKHKDFHKHTIELKQGTTFYIFSDGFQDQFGGAEGKKYGLKQLKDFLFSIHLLPFEEQERRLAMELTAWHGTKEHQTDDILVMGFRV